MIYLYNPFTGDVMRKVAQHVFQSWVSNPRPLFIVYAVPLLENLWTDEGFLAVKRGDSFAILVPPR